MSGELETIVSYLEMRSPPRDRPRAAPRGDVAIVRAERPTVSFYRYLYNTVGKEWLWADRRKLSDDELRAILCSDAVEVWVLYVAGTPAGYYELDRRQAPEIELAYFGLIPAFIGQRLGEYLLDCAIHKAWSYSPSRFWVHTQTLDHPRALPLYQRLGFVEYKRERLLLDDPRLLGLL